MPNTLRGTVLFLLEIVAIESGERLDDFVVVTKGGQFVIPPMQRRKLRWRLYTSCCYRHRRTYISHQGRTK